jgi:HEAT repeat protein
MSALHQLMDQAQLAPGYRVVIFFILTLGAIALAFCLVLVAHHGVTSTRRRRRTAVVQRAMPFLAPYVATGDKLAQGVAESRRLHGDWATAIVLREARRELRGDRAALLTAALVDMGEIARLRHQLQSRQDWRRIQAARELGQCGGDEARDLLVQALEDKSPEVRRAAREGLLADARSASIKAAIASFRNDSDVVPTWQRSFYARLAATAPDEVRDLLASQSLERAEEKLALEALGEARVATALPLARARLADPEPELRATAARVIGKLGDAQSIPLLTGMLSDPEWFVRAAAAKAFDNLRVDDGAFRALRRSMSDETWWVRVNAAHALAQQGDGGVETLLSAVEGDDAYSRDAGLAALGHAMMAPATRRRLEGTLRRMPEDSPASPLRRLLESVPPDRRPIAH